MATHVEVVLLIFEEGKGLGGSFDGQLKGVILCANVCTLGKDGCYSFCI